MKLLDTIFYGRYLPLDDVVRDVNTNLAIKAEKQPVRAHACREVAAVIVYKLSKKE